MRSFAALASCAIVFASTVVRAQDADTIVLKNNDRKFTLVSQIQDPEEARAFLAMLQTTDARTRNQLAGEFLKRYPQSWLLPQVLDASARSAIEISKYQDALIDARFSLRFLPENPSLLILVANVEAQQAKYERAIADADDGLEYLGGIERLPNMTQSEWDIVRPQLEASAYFARARAKTGRALAAAPHDSTELSRAFEDLNRAAAWNGDDAEIFYLRGIVELNLGKQNEAASDLAFVTEHQSPLRDKAMSILRLLSKPDGAPFEAFVKALPERARDTSLRSEARPAKYRDVLASGYAGPEVCKECHANEYQNWRKTGMARMFRPYRPENVAGDFSGGSEYKEDDADVIRMGQKQGRPYFDVLTGARWERFFVDYTIGSKWQQGYATKLSDGRLQVLPIEYNMLRRQWVNYWKIIDPPGSPRAVIHDFPKLTAATNYQQNCAICHTSQLKLDPAAADPMQHASYFQPGIDCEMCHGPAARHVRRMKNRVTESAQADPTRPPFDFRRANNRDAVRVCAQCHRQSAVRETGPEGEMNYSTGASFVPATWLRPLDAFSRRAFYKDGRFRETTFIVEAFTRSACYRRGTAQCASCHSPHLPDFDNNPTSLKYRQNSNEMCLQCHAGYRGQVAEHTHHAAGTEASQCVSCHMPRIVNALLFKARSHQIEIPTADLTKRFEQQESPNACLECHSNKTAGWAMEQLASWRQ